MTLLAAVLVAIGFPLLVFTLGRSVLVLLPGLDAEERFGASWAVGFAVLAGAQFIAFVTGASAPTFQLLVIASLFSLAWVGCWLLGRLPAGLLRTDEPEAGYLAGVWALSYLQLVCIQALLPLYVGSAWYFDWWMHYDASRVFVGQTDVRIVWMEQYTIASRTPLFNLAAAFLMSLAGSPFWVFQLGASLMSSCFLPALYLILRDLFGRRTARFAVLLAPLNLWLLHIAWFTWPKMLTVCYLLLALYCYLQFVKRRPSEPAVAGRWFTGFFVLGCLGFLTHQAAGVYVGVLLLHLAVLAWRNRVFRPSLREAIFPLAASLVLIGSWYGWLLGTFGPREVLFSTPVSRMVPGGTPSALAWLEVVGGNLLLSVVPVQLFSALLLGPRTFAPVYQALTAMYFSQLPGVLTGSLMLFALIVGWRVRSPGTGQEGTLADRRVWQVVWMFLLGGGILTALLHPARTQYGIAHAALFPTAVLGAALAWGWLARLPRHWAGLVCTGMILELLVMLWSHLWLVSTPEILEPRNTTLLTKSVRGAVCLQDVLSSHRVIFLSAVILIQIALAGMVAVRLPRPRSVGRVLPTGEVTHVCPTK